MLATKSKFAEAASVSRAAITKACNKGGPLYSAVCGKFLDVDCEAARSYLRKKDIDPHSVIEWMKTNGNVKSDRSSMRKQPERRTVADRIPPDRMPKKKATPKEPEDTFDLPTDFLDGLDTMDIPADITSFYDMTLQQIVEMFGTETKFEQWLQATKTIEDINTKKLKNSEIEGKLVSRDRVKVAIIDPINTCHMNLLSDGAKTMAVRAHAMCKSGANPQELQEYFADRMTKFIRPMKTQMAKEMK